MNSLKQGMRKRLKVINSMHGTRYILLFILAIVCTAVIVFLMLPSVSCRLSRLEVSKGEIDKDSLEEDSYRSSEGSNGSLADPWGRDRLVVGSDTSYPSFEFLNNGNPDGFDMDIAKEISKRLERELEVVSMPWESIYEEVSNGTIDMAISAIPLRHDKEKLVDFSIPYFTMEYLLVSLKGTEIKVKEDLYGKLIGVLKIEKDNLKNDYLANFQVSYYENIINMLDDLKNKNIDGVLVSVPMGVSILKENKDMYMVLDRTNSNLEFVIVFRKGSELKKEVDRVLEEMREDGTYQRIYDKWFEL
ncbi:MAG: amino acid ABC transporter substrate-binding protein [Actinobacteria bacterium]|nr:amino acid ABC transporter substrate-binding protein [Actinomycetota bacterium]